MFQRGRNFQASKNQTKEYVDHINPYQNSISHKNDGILLPTMVKDCLDYAEGALLVSFILLSYIVLPKYWIKLPYHGNLILAV